jgi:uncharacterized protein
LFLDAFSDGSGFALNRDDPCGVKYLTNNGFRRLRELIAMVGDPPIVSAGEQDGDVLSLASQGLVRFHGCDTSPRYATTQPKSLVAWLHVSNACNLLCSHCYIPKLNRVHQEPEERSLMSTETARRAVRALVGLCQGRGIGRLKLKFSGGEPTLNPVAIACACDEALRAGANADVKIEFTLLTNGVFDDPDLLALVSRHRFGVAVSIDGDEVAHDRVRYTVNHADSRNAHRKIGTWRRATRTCEVLQDCGLKPFVLCTISESNYRSVGRLAEYCVERGIGFRLSPVRDRSNVPSYGLQADMARYFAELYDRIGHSMPLDMPVERYAAFGEIRFRKPKAVNCRVHRSAIAINHQGGIAACQMTLDTSYGSVDDLGGMERAFERMTSSSNIGAMATAGDDCARCDWRYVCAGGCPEYTRAAMGDVNAVSPWCELYRSVLPQFARAIAFQLKRAVDIHAVANPT